MNGKLMIFFGIILFLFSCTSSERSNDELFYNKWGIVYFERPYLGRTTTVVFLPLKDSTIVLNGDVASLLNNIRMNNGIQFTTANTNLLNILDSFKNQSSKGSAKRLIIWSLAKIKYHTDKIFDEKTVIDKAPQTDTLVNQKKTILTTYYFSSVTVDSIITFSSVLENNCRNSPLNKDKK